MNEKFSDERLSAYLDNELPLAERIAFEREMGEDPALRQAVEELRFLHGSLGALPRHKLEGDFAARILELAERQILTSSAPRSPAQSTPLPVSTVSPVNVTSPASGGSNSGFQFRNLLWAATAASVAVVLTNYYHENERNKTPVEVAATDHPSTAGNKSEITEKRKGNLDQEIRAHAGGSETTKKPGATGIGATGIGATGVSATDSGAPAIESDPTHRQQTDGTTEIADRTNAVKALRRNSDLAKKDGPKQGITAKGSADHTNGTAEQNSDRIAIAGQHTEVARGGPRGHSQEAQEAEAVQFDAAAFAANASFGQFGLANSTTVIVVDVAPEALQRGAFDQLLASNRYVLNTQNDGAIPDADALAASAGSAAAEKSNADKAIANIDNVVEDNMAESKVTAKALTPGNAGRTDDRDRKSEFARASGDVVAVETTADELDALLAAVRSRPNEFSQVQRYDTSPTFGGGLGGGFDGGFGSAPGGGGATSIGQASEGKHREQPAETMLADNAPSRTRGGASSRGVRGDAPASAPAFGKRPSDAARSVGPAIVPPAPASIDKPAISKSPEASRSRGAADEPAKAAIDRPTGEPAPEALGDEPPRPTAMAEGAEGTKRRAGDQVAASAKGKADASADVEGALPPRGYAMHLQPLPTVQARATQANSRPDPAAALSAPDRAGTEIVADPQTVIRPREAQDIAPPSNVILPSATDAPAAKPSGEPAAPHIAGAQAKPAKPRAAAEPVPTAPLPAPLAPRPEAVPNDNPPPLKAELLPPNPAPTDAEEKSPPPNAVPLEVMPPDAESSAEGRSLEEANAKKPRAEKRGLEAVDEGKHGKEEQGERELDEHKRSSKESSSKENGASRARSLSRPSNGTLAGGVALPMPAARVRVVFILRPTAAAAQATASKQHDAAGESQGGPAYLPSPAPPAPPSPP